MAGDEGAGGEGTGGEVPSEDAGEDIRWAHPDALRAAVLTANGVHARRRWKTKQGFDYSTFRFALKDASGAKLRRAPESVDGAREPTPSATASATTSGLAVDAARRDVGRTSPAPARTRYAPALVANAEAGSENPSRLAESPLLLGDSPGARLAAPRVVRWCRGDERAGAPAKIALGRADGSVDILTARETFSRLETSGGENADDVVGYRLDSTRALDAKRHAAPVVDIDWSAAGDRLVTACEAGDVRVWSLAPASDATSDATKEKADDGDDEEAPARAASRISRGGADSRRCSRVVACGDSGADTSGADSGADAASTPDAPPVVAARFHPLNAETVFVARRERSDPVWVLNAGTGRVSARLATSATHVPADLRAACVDALGSFVYAGDTEGRVLALRYVRADANRGSRFSFAGARRDAGETRASPSLFFPSETPSNVLTDAPAVTKPKSSSFASRWRGRAEPAARRSLSPPRGGPGGPAPKTKNAVSFSPRRGGEHAVSFAGRAAPPTNLTHPEISGVSHAPFAVAAGGAAVFATFRCGAVRVYKTTFGARESAGSSFVEMKRRRGGGKKAFGAFGARGALTPALTVTFPSWPVGSRKLSTFVAVAPTLSPLSAAECCVSVFGGGAAAYALPSVAGAPPARVGALAAGGNEAAVCAAFDGAARILLVGYEGGGVLLWRRIEEEG